MADERYNMKNPAVKRIMQEVREMQNSGSEEFMSLPMQDNLFEWQFAIRGPVETEFEGGIYHGRIQLPPEYPFRPPAFMLLTPNGRFETQTKICLSISQHHPEHWQPSWSVRTALVALIAFLPTKPDGALGSLDYTKEERRTLAGKSRSAPPKFGNADRQQLIDEIHESMLKKTPPVPLRGPPAPVVETLKKRSAAMREAAAVAAAAAAVGDDCEPDGVRQEEPTGSDLQGAQGGANSVGFREPTGAAQMEQTPASGARAGTPFPAVESRGLLARLGLADDMGLTILAIGLTVLIIAILVKKALNISVLPPEIDS